MAEQQVSITDLDPAQLQEVKKQLDQVGFGSLVYFSQLSSRAWLPPPSLGRRDQMDSRGIDDFG
jgi:hypothetical protein